MQNQPSSLNIWWLAFRPKTLTAAIAPMMIATAMAYADGAGHALTAIVCLLTALLLQIGTNLANDYFDFKKGADNAKRTGPTRVTQAGLLTPETVHKAFIISFALTGFGWWYLIERVGWFIVAVVAIASILSGIFYTAGKKAYGYIGLGEVFVLIFFGPVAVAGTHYAQTLSFSYISILAGFAPGLISVAILTVNNLRDIDSDREANKKTLAVRLGAKFAKLEYLTAILAATAIPVFIYLLSGKHPAILISVLANFVAIPIIYRVMSEDGAILNQALADTGRLLLIFSVLFSVGWLW